MSKDRTAGERVRRYRNAQSRERGIRRVEVQLPAWGVHAVKARAARLRSAREHADAARADIDLILGTLNAPRPEWIDAETLVSCLYAEQADPRWIPHMRAFFDEISIGAIHDIVLAGVVDFETLYRAARTWRALDGNAAPWIKEMADLKMEGPAP
ncbi:MULTISPECIES: hypothetical protein [Parvibaculum]|uniref:hypothetical protein n=1 Tax=Parvibaculum TaxID=256616 RepID=UPI001420A336|nr:MULTISPECIES: hypothetical protein [Parvibaculum]NIJ40602.1 hypothetical protein [Parvibaculum indicum]